MSYFYGIFVLVYSKGFRNFKITLIKYKLDYSLGKSNIFLLYRSFRHLKISVFFAYIIEIYAKKLIFWSTIKKKSHPTK